MAAQQHVLVADHAPGLGRGDEARADPHAVGAEGQGGGQPAAVDDAARGHDRYPVADGVDDLGTGAIVATRPVCPPASVPWATTMSHPASTASTAWRTLPHMFTTSSPLVWHRSTTSRGTPSAATNAVTPPVMMSPTFCSSPRGSAVSRSTPNGLSVALATATISSRISSSPIVEAPVQPKPPADRGDQAVVRHAAHAGQHDGVVDLEGVGQSGAQRGRMLTLT